MNKCKICGAPLEGFLYNTIGKLMGIKPSANDPQVCNKCEEEANLNGSKEDQTSEEENIEENQLKTESADTNETEEKNEEITKADQNSEGLADQKIDQAENSDTQTEAEEVKDKEQIL